ncbi:MAG: VanZ family protein [Lachnospiraceae bacterium]|nr:VanZ family protein [Lachnospiraceae bacterium]
MKINVYVRIVAAILAVAWMMRIFSYSSDNADSSMQVSRSFSYDLVKSANDILKMGWDEDRVYGVSKAIEKTVRKTAHMCEYAVLGFLTGIACDAWRYLGTKRSPKYIRTAVAFLICLVYACSDEFHQTFVDGRSGEIRDVCIDISGVLIALLLGCAVVLLIVKHKAMAGQTGNSK